MSKLYFLGPKGTYSEQAALKINGVLNNKFELSPVSTIAKIVELVNKNADDVAVLPIENSIEGIVRQTIDNIYLDEAKIQAEIDVKVKHCLISNGKKEQIKHIVSHPQALAQCSKYILQNFDENIDLISQNSTSASVDFIMDKDETFSAIASFELAKTTKLNIIDENIGDIKENKTRFILLSLKKINLAKNSRTSIMFNTKNESGALLKILEIFKKYNLNLVYLESRPSKEVFGEYNFFADIDEGIEKIENALKEVEQECKFYKLLGSYPII